jgi:hypothetical protein
MPLQELNLYWTGIKDLSPLPSRANWVWNWVRAVVHA